MTFAEVIDKFIINKEFTGYSDDVYRLCQEKYEQDGILMALEKSKLMDSALRRSDLFDRI